MQYLIDTNILIHHVRADATWEAVRDRYQLLTIEPTPMISIVSEAELRAFAWRQNWGGVKLDRMEFCLGYFTAVYVHNREIVNAYVEIDAVMHSMSRVVSKNDLWIAATALSTGARLLTTDRDFDPLSPGLIALDRIAPATPG